MSERPQGNLWIALARDYWSDPRNVIGPPGALVRRIFKALWLALSVYVLFYIAGPSQVASWRLWMEDDTLAMHIAWGFTLAGALGFAIVRYAAEGTQPFRVPLLIPIIEFEEKRYKGWHIKPLHLHVPNLTVSIGGVLVGALFAISLLGMLNYYLHEQQRSGGASVAAIEGSTDRVAEATAALAAFEARSRSSLQTVDRAIAETSAGSPTGRSRLVQQRSAMEQAQATERQSLQRELREARSATVSTHQSFADPRPVDGLMAGVTGLQRNVVASLLDLMRSGVVEMLLVMGAALGLVGATSRLGVPAAEPEAEPEIVPEVKAEIEEPAPVPPRPRRFTLPAATEDDYALANAVGPQARVETPEAAAPDEAAPEPAETADEAVSEAANDEASVKEEIDPLVAEMMARQREEEAA